MNLIGHVYKVMHKAEILIGHFREIVRNWQVASSYFALCNGIETYAQYRVM